MQSNLGIVFEHLDEARYIPIRPGIDEANRYPVGRIIALSEGDL